MPRAQHVSLANKLLRIVRKMIERPPWSLSNLTHRRAFQLTIVLGDSLPNPRIGAGLGGRKETNPAVRRPNTHHHHPEILLLSIPASLSSAKMGLHWKRSVVIDSQGNQLKPRQFIHQPSESRLRRALQWRRTVNIITHFLWRHKGPPGDTMTSECFLELSERNRKCVKRT